MRTESLRKGFVYSYQSTTEQADVMYTGYDFCPSIGWGYGFKAYNEESGKYDGWFNILSKKTVENMVTPK